MSAFTLCTAKIIYGVNLRTRSNYISFLFLFLFLVLQRKKERFKRANFILREGEKDQKEEWMTDRGCFLTHTEMKVYTHKDSKLFQKSCQCTCHFTQLMYLRVNIDYRCQVKPSTQVSLMGNS